MWDLVGRIFQANFQRKSLSLSLRFNFYIAFQKFWGVEGQGAKNLDLKMDW
jgi:hypothetical protein